MYGRRLRIERASVGIEDPQRVAKHAPQQPDVFREGQILAGGPREFSVGFHRAWRRSHPGIGRTGSAVR